MESAESNKEILEALREVLVDRLKVEAEAVTPQANLFARKPPRGLQPARSARRRLRGARRDEP
jgi:hypothetical protein